MAQYVTSHKDTYDKIIISTRLEWSYIYVLFYSHYSPAQYLAQGGTKSGGWAEEGNKFGRFEYHKFDFAPAKNADHILYIGLPSEFPDDVRPLDVIKYPDGKDILYIVSK